MLDSFFKLVLILATSPIWLPILRSIRDQLAEIEAQERDHDAGARLGSPGHGRGPAPTFNDDLVEERLAPVRARGHGFRAEPAGSGMRRAG